MKKWQILSFVLGVLFVYGTFILQHRWEYDYSLLRALGFAVEDICFGFAVVTVGRYIIQGIASRRDLKRRRVEFDKLHAWSFSLMTTNEMREVKGLRPSQVILDEVNEQLRSARLAEERVNLIKHVKEAKEKTDD